MFNLLFLFAPLFYLCVGFLMSQCVIAFYELASIGRKSKKFFRLDVF